MKKLLIPVLFGIFLVGCGNPEKYEVADISDFDYSISGDSVILESYEGNNKYLEIPSTYEISGSQYNVDLNEFQVGSGPTTLVLSEGITSVNNSIFNGSDIESVFFPSSMEYIYDDTLSYLHPDDDKIQIYYAGTSVDWTLLLKSYETERQSLSEAWNSSDDPYEKGEAVGKSLADGLNSLFGGYNINDLEFHYESTPDNLKEEG